MKYLDVIANAIMLQNVSDLKDVLIEMANEDWVITQEHLAGLSPYVREHILRFGRLSLDMDDTPGPLQPRAVPVTETEG